MELIDKYMWYQEGPGVRKNQYTSFGVKLLNVANLVEGKIELSTSSRYISEDEANGRYNHFLVDEGDLIIASSGIQVSYFEKKMGIAEKKHLPLCMNTSTIRFKVLDKNITDIRYFMYFLKSNVFKKQIRKLITGSAQLNFGPSHLKKIKIEMPELKKQQEIVKKLDRVKKIIDIRNNQIIELNELIKSQFVEMFGDIKIKEKVKNVSVYFSRGKTPNYVEKSNIKVISQACIYWDEFEYEKAKYQDENKALKSLEKMIENGDVLITSTGTGTLGRCNVYYGEEHKYMADSHVSILRLNYKEVNPIFFKYYFMQEKVQKELYAECVNGSTNQIELSKDRFLNFRILIPEITLQNQFSEIVKQIDKQKFESMIQLKMMEKIYNIINDRRRYV